MQYVSDKKRTVKFCQKRKNNPHEFRFYFPLFNMHVIVSMEYDINMIIRHLSVIYTGITDKVQIPVYTIFFS